MLAFVALFRNGLLVFFLRESQGVYLVSSPITLLYVAFCTSCATVSCLLYRWIHRGIFFCLTFSKAMNAHHAVSTGFRSLLCAGRFLQCRSIADIVKWFSSDDLLNNDNLFGRWSLGSLLGRVWSLFLPLKAVDLVVCRSFGLYLASLYFSLGRWWPMKIPCDQLE